MLEVTFTIDESFKAPSSAMKDYIYSLASHQNVAYVKTDSDTWPETVTWLAGDDVEMDDIECTLIALRRAGVIDKNRWAYSLLLIFGRILMFDPFKDFETNWCRKFISSSVNGDLIVPSG